MNINMYLIIFILKCIHVYAWVFFFEAAYAWGFKLVIVNIRVLTYSVGFL